VLKFNQGLSNAEIAAVLGRSEGAIKSLYHRTLLALRSELEPLGADAGAEGDQYGEVQAHHEARSDE
jgi:DNA-directed RNA polymerase specialized sigma24 family protein